MKNILIFFFALVSIQAFGCECIPAPLLYYYQKSDFVAAVKVVEITLDREHHSSEGDYHYLNIEIVQLYKGKEVPFIRVNTASETSCAFEVPKGSTWLVFASMGDNDIPVFGSCSGSEPTEPYYDMVKYPKAANNYKNRIDLKLAVLSFLKNNELEDSNPYNLNINDIGLHDTTLFREFDNQNRFAVYELDINEDLSIGKITARQAFDNPKLAQLFTEYLRKNARVNNTRLKGIPTKSRLIVIYYYYPAEGKDPSFISDFDL
ncbi:hypothetical protein [Salmonirosea aquatica]|uniref:Tissue inhibitor of metalloproteinase n=1 Tax=Salmonirosea aquatica TaxID=2654236 RepID=A0A7C9BA09_9BACT|nr:hypothetical protein [Cytophagaceae bacterium SJW1-29]